MKHRLFVTAAGSCLFFPTASIAGSAITCAAAKVPASLDVVDRMLADKLDLVKPREVSHLFLGEPKRLSTLRPLLSNLGYRSSLSAEEGRLLAVSLEIVTSQWVQTTVPKMCAAAERASVEYDGWDVDVAADKIKE